jgi:hypothetical protein
MADTTLGTIDELLAGAIADTDDAEVRFKLRNARQLLLAVEQHHDDLDDAIEAAVDDGEVMRNLRDLGYVE